MDEVKLADPFLHGPVRGPTFSYLSTNQCNGSIWPISLSFHFIIDIMEHPCVSPPPFHLKHLDLINATLGWLLTSRSVPKRIGMAEYTVPQRHKNVQRSFKPTSLRVSCATRLERSV